MEDITALTHAESLAELEIQLEWESFPEQDLVAGRYRFDSDTDRILGEGVSGVCYRGVDICTGGFVAIKVYKQDSRDNKINKSMSNGTTSIVQVEKTLEGDIRRHKALQRFRQTVSVLQELQAPLKVPSEASLWCRELEQASPSELFVQMLGFSKPEGASEPGRDCSGGLFLVTELGELSLRDHLELQQRRNQLFPQALVRSMARDIVKSVAALHSKGLVHLDMKPENLMMFEGGRLKLIDVDGCLTHGASIRRDEGGVTFTPLYAAPRMARFIVDRQKRERCLISSPMDVWSVGAVLFELATLQALFAPWRQQYGKEGLLQRLAQLDRSPGESLSRDLFEGLESFDGDLLDMISNWMLLPDISQRKTLAQCFKHPYFTASSSDFAFL